jgi:chromosome segregation ATPase
VTKFSAARYPYKKSALRKRQPKYFMRGFWVSQLDSSQADLIQVDLIPAVSAEVTQNPLAPMDWVGDRPMTQQLLAQTAMFDPADPAAQPELALTPADYHALLEELAQAQALDQEKVSRIFHLEQALDQALAYLEELRLTLQDQAILEGQLAATEDYASVQQQAIARLKLQMGEQQQALEAQILETQQRDQAIQELLTTIEAMTQAQQQEVERLRLRMSQDQQEAQNHRNRMGKQVQDLQTALESRHQRVSELEAEMLASRTATASLQGQLEASQQQIRELSASLRQYRSSLAQLEAQIEQTHVVLEERHTRGAHLRRTQTVTAEQSSAIALQKDLTKAQRQVEALEEQLAQQSIQHTRLQQSHQELESDRQIWQTREASLEQQIAEMQEQILQQAQQVAEHETAIQYWRDRHATSQRQIIHIRDLVEHSLSELTEETAHLETPDEAHLVLAELLTAIQTIQPAMPPEHLEPIALPLPRLGTVELPNFLVRRRAQTRDQAP